MTLGPADIATLRRKVAWRIVPLVVLLYFIAYLDRANVGFAKLRMAGGRWASWPNRNGWEDCLTSIIALPRDLRVGAQTMFWQRRAETP